MRPHILWGLIWIQIVCKGNQRSSKFDATVQRVNDLLLSYLHGPFHLGVCFEVAGITVLDGYAEVLCYMLDHTACHILAHAAGELVQHALVGLVELDLILEGGPISIHLPSLLHCLTMMPTKYTEVLIRCEK